MLLRDTLVENALLEIKRKKEGVYKIYDNRWVNYIYGNHAETVAFQRRLTSLTAIYACISLTISMMRSLY